MMSYFIEDFGLLNSTVKLLEITQVIEWSATALLREFLPANQKKIFQILTYLCSQWTNQKIDP